MLSAAPPPFSSRFTPSPLLRDVQVLYRRICVLRATGKSAEADALETGKLADAIAKLHESSTSIADLDQRLEALFAKETERVDTAHALAELLLPMLTAADESGVSRRSRAPTPGFEFSAARETSVPSQAGADGIPPAPSTGPMLPGIADFIDEMLVQERAPRRPN